MPRLTRREVLQLGTQAAALTLLPPALRGRPLLVELGGVRPVPVPPITDPDVKQLALRAVEASRAAGAAYADVRLSHTYRRAPNTWMGRNWWGVDEEQMHVGVRALVNGYWGFAASGTWSPEEMGRLAQEAVQLAKLNAQGKPRRVELAPTPKVPDGHWTTPVKVDPFTLNAAEINDVARSIGFYVQRYRSASGETPLFTHGGDALPTFRLQARAFASTEGSYCTQRLYWSQGRVTIAARLESSDARLVGALDTLSPAGVGWELYRDQDLKAVVWQLLEAMDADLKLPRVPLAVGRYDTVVDARAVATLLDGTLGRATELDRALGYKANATGTSYLTDPFGMVGSYPAGAALLTVTANRSEPGGCATVQWDDEGVRPADFTLVKDGVLTDFQTTRESASWLADYYAKQQRPVRSQGCAAVSTALDAPLIHTPNLVLAPGREAQDFDALVGTLKNGIAVKTWGQDLELDMDFQCLNGYVPEGHFYQVKDGRVVAKLMGSPALLFRAPELWKGVLALGGVASARRYGLSASKGEPVQATYHSVTAPPAVFKQLTLIDAMRKA